MTVVVSHTCRRTAWRQSRHAYLIDVGYRIGIRQETVSSAGGPESPAAPPGTRYFEVEIDELRAQGKKTYALQSIVPVLARKKPDWHILRFRIRHGAWTVTERIPPRASDRDPPWIYTDDFNILFLSSGGGHDLATLMSLITAKLDGIASSEHAGTPVPSQFENQLACRDAVGAMFQDGVSAAFRTTLPYRQYTAVPSGKQPVLAGLSQADTESASGRAVAAPILHLSDLNVDISRIEELDDLSWLYE